MAAPPDSGITGIVRAAPRCLPPPGPKCTTRARSLTIAVYRVTDGARVATVRPRPLGVFRIRLAPGRYLLRLDTPPGAGTALPATRQVRVRPHAFTFVVLAPNSRIVSAG
jgi:hypothetical protein